MNTTPLNKLVCISLILFTLHPAAQAARTQNEKGSLSERVDKIFAAWDKPDSPGCELAVIKDG